MNAWDLEQRRVHLLNPQIEHPLSIDDAVWPVPDDADAFLVQSGYGELGEVDANPFNLMLTIPDLWLKEGLPKSVKSRYRLIAATVGDSDFSELKKIYQVIMKSSGEKMLSAVTSEWQDLGFDVMDQTAISGLSACGLGDAVAANERQNFSSKLNEHGLVIEEAAAREIATMLNKLASEHAPFLPVRLWQSKR